MQCIISSSVVGCKVNLLLLCSIWDMCTTDMSTAGPLSGTIIKPRETSYVCANMDYDMIMILMRILFIHCDIDVGLGCLVFPLVN